MNIRRSYSMAVRGAKAAENRVRIAEAAGELFEVHSSAFTLDDVAARSGTSVQTVLRAFGSKQQLLVETIGSSRTRLDPDAFADSLEGVVAQLFEDYEKIGDRVIRVLAEEDRVDGFAELAAEGRRSHRAWIETAFGADLRRLSQKRRAHVATALLAATDVYLWKLLRRDLGLERPAAEAVMVRLVQGALA
jgi:AcrR family transcriptional regulator